MDSRGSTSTGHVLDAFAFKYASETLKSSKFFLLACLQINPEVFNWIPSTFREDEQFCAEIIQAQINNVDLTSKVLYYHGNLLRFASQEDKDNTQIVSIAVDSSPCAIKFASDRIRKSSELFPGALQACAGKGCYCLLIPLISACSFSLSSQSIDVVHTKDN